MNREHDELLELCEAIREQTLSETQWRRLQELLKNSDSRRIYLDYMSMVGMLGECLDDYSAAREDATEDTRQMMLKALIAQSTRGDKPVEPVRERRRWVVHLAYVTAVSILGVLLWQGLGTRAGESEFGSLSGTQGCKWGAGTLPTVAGTRLASGRLNLLEGFAKIELDNGVRLMLEAPIALTLRSPTHCEVRAGQLLATVPSAEIGFTVTTPTTEVLDLGTEFAVRVEQDGSTGVHVLDGEVNLTNLRSGEEQRLGEQQVAHVGSEGIATAEQNEESFGSRGDLDTDGPIQSRLISTANGRGKDAFVFRELSSGYRGEDKLLIKHCVPHRNQWDRKVYLAFDIASLEGFEVRQAELQLHLTPSELGYVTGQLDSIFQVYGLIDESGDHWNESNLTWQNAPANEEGADSVSADATVKLGSFVVRQGVQTGRVGLSGEPLRQFLRTDNNGMVTFIIVRETRERAWDGGGLVHAFLSKEHPHGLPPTLRLLGNEAVED